MPTRHRQARWREVVQLGVVAVLVAILVWLVVELIKDVGKADNLASVLSAGLATSVVIVTLVTPLWRRRAAAAALATPEQLVQAGEVLAGNVLEQWRREAEVRSLGDPEPMPIRWRLSSAAVMDHPRVIAPGGLSFSGRSDRMMSLVGQFRRLDRRRLVITGGPGSGKTTLAVQLLLELLDHPQPGEPVPVVFSLVGWDAQSHPRVQDWLTARLELDYPALRSFGANTASALVERGTILPILDGLDEISEDRRPRIITALNACLAADSGVVLTSRSSEYIDAVDAADVLTAAAVVHPEPLTATEVATYLRTRLPPNLSVSWSDVLTALETGAAVDLAEVAATPLGLWLVSTVHIDERSDPRCLIDGIYPDRASIQAHLFDQLITAAIRSRPPTADRDPLRPRHRYHPDDVRRWLTRLADQLTAPDPDQPRRDWQWWHLARDTFSSHASALAARLVFGLVVGLVVGLAGGLVFGLAFGLAVGLAFGLAVGLASVPAFGLTASPQHADLRLRGRWIELLRRLVFGLAVGLAGGLAVGLAFGLAFGLAVGLAGGLAGGLAVGLAGGLVFGLAVGLISGPAGGLVFGLSEFISSTSAAQRATSPSSSHRGDRASIVVRSLATGLLFGVAVGVAGGLVVGLAGGLATGLMLGLAGRAWPAFVIASLWLAARRRLPLRVMPFLEDAYRLGLLRIVGSSYQFRHTELQDHLTESEPVDQGIAAPVSRGAADGYRELVEINRDATA